MELGTSTIEKRRSLLWPVVFVLVGIGVFCRWNLPQGDPRIDVFTEGLDDNHAFLGDLIQSTGSALMGGGGDWEVHDLGLIKLAEWNPKGWVREETGAESMHAVALPFADGWRELSRNTN